MGKKKETVKCAVCGKKSKFPELQSGFENRGLLRSVLCPVPDEILEEEINGVIQRCSNEKCGYVFPRIDEDMGVSKRMLQMQKYRQPFGAAYEVLRKAAEGEVQREREAKMQCVHGAEAKWEQDGFTREPDMKRKQDSLAPEVDAKWEQDSLVLETEARLQVFEGAADCARIALVYRSGGSSFQAAVWFIRAAVLLYQVMPGPLQTENSEETERAAKSIPLITPVLAAAQSTCYSNAEEQLEAYMHQRFWRSRCPEWDQEAVIGHLNLMRLQGMFDRVEKWGSEKQYQYTGTGRDLIETLIRLAKEKNSTYMTYSEMLRYVP